MTTLTITGSGVQSHTSDNLTGVDAITFNTSGASDVIFSATQFAVAAPVIAITGDANANTIEVLLTSGQTFSAAPWTFANWSVAADILYLIGSTGGETITGSAVTDVLIGGGGSDTLDGGGGSDYASYQSDTAVTVSLAIVGSQDTVGAGTDTLTNIENLIGSSTGGDTLTGDDNANQLLGLGGADTLRGGGGNDSLDGGDGNDSFDGGAGHDTVTYASAAAGVTVSLAILGAQQNTGGGDDDTFIGGVENLVGSSHADTLTGDGGPNQLFGGGDNDTLNGGGGDDFLDGGAGNDTFNGGAGSDIVSYSAAATGVTVSLVILGTQQNTGGAGLDTFVGGVENLLGSSHTDSLTGNGGANVLVGGDDNDKLNGGGGNDTLFGGLGNDQLAGGAGNDTVSYVDAGGGVRMSLAPGNHNTGAAGVDTASGVENLVGSAFADTLTGNTGNNSLLGGAGNDAVSGGSGKDFIEGDAGNDTLSGGLGLDGLFGGAGADRFDFNALGESRAGGLRDQILDFHRAQHDKIDLTDIDANTHQGGNQSFHFIGTHFFDGHPGELRYESHVVQADVNGDGSPDFEIFVNHSPALHTGDFFL
jgi:Ca2+-binding RTX toxin-like protein